MSLYFFLKNSFKNLQKIGLYFYTSKTKEATSNLFGVMNCIQKIIPERVYLIIEILRKRH